MASAASLTLLSPFLPNSSKSSLIKLRISNANQNDISMQENLNLININNNKGKSLRREILVKGLAMLPLVVLGGAPISDAKEVEVGSYLPPSPTNPSFVVFKASPKDTPALRAGNVQPYQFLIPPTWKQSRVANILSGNYCQPKCAEPWVEVKFEDENQGKVQVVASPLIRLTNKPNATIEEIGSPEKVIASLGAFVTGNSYDPDELLETSVERLGQQTYYKYVLETPFALTGSHNLAKATAKGSTVVLFVASANDKQWSTSQKTLKAMLDSFQL
ncbi:psbP domain-containing protein 6, chloroplastic [Durio zibethinus]|uniref:PsbP domain-containing protein 6, chloroplastic n=1 Tax=Durio zibethinus TaxID=66656 RepID=A0A6P5Z2H6_DURZI|nr:psbP domain-containing protein 6, chloroplastic [Durio zibethinus]